MLTLFYQRCLLGLKILVILGPLGFALCAQASYGCLASSYTASDIHNAADSSTEVFTGTIVSQVASWEEKSSWQTRYFCTLKIRVNKLWKGNKTRIKYLSMEGGSFGPGENIFFSSSSDDGMVLTGCSDFNWYDPKLYDPELNSMYGAPTVAQAYWPKEPTPFWRKYKWFCLLGGTAALVGLGSLVNWVVKLWNMA